MTAYYNEIDPYAAQWLRNLISAGHIADGIVDERSIEDVHPRDLDGFTQCHFFAGIGVWSYALRRAGWPDDRPVWTGSCPCQPFSVAGQGKGINDERHLWPAFLRLIAACRPGTVFGEQVSSSLVTGAGTSSAVQRLWERKARLGILANWLEEDISIALQGMQEQDGARIASDAQGLYLHESIKADGSRQVTRCAEGPSIRLDGGMGPISAGLWSLRGYRDCFRPDIEAWLEHTIARPDPRGRGIHDGKHQGDSVRSECGVRELGREQGHRDGERNREEAARAIRRASEETDGELEKANGGAWVDTLQTDLEALDYALGCVAFPSAGVGAPHIRDRLFWVADADVMRSHRGGPARSRWRTQYPDRGAACELGNSECEGLAFGQRLYGVPGGACRADAGQAAERTSVHPCGVAYPECALRGCEAESASHYGPKAIRSADRAGGCGGASCQLADADGRDACPEGVQRGRQHGQQPQDSGAACIAHAGPTNGLWRDADWLLCRDGRWRPVEPGTQPLATGIANRVGRLRAYGNAINAEAAHAFIAAYLESI